MTGHRPIVPVTINFFDPGMAMKSVDLNCDMGEGFGAYEIGCDDDMLEIVSSMNLACGFHAGDFSIMSRLSKKAGQMGVAIGAHPGYPDLWGYGRRKMVFTNDELEAIFAYQIGAAAAMAKLHGYKMSYIKAHGAIAHLAAEDPSVGEVYAGVIQKIDPSLTVLAMVNTPVIEILKSKGIRVAYEIFADRGYLDNGRLVPRGQPGAMIHDSDEAASRIVDMVSNQCIISHSGKRVPTQIDSICVHGDTPDAAPIARKVRQALETAGWSIRPFS